MASKGFEQPGKLPTVSRFKSREVNQLVVSAVVTRYRYPYHHEGRLPLEGCRHMSLGLAVTRWKCPKHK